ncbi:hypothetical protein BSR29_00620 [Boudabousia liubingyangii]|uniref:Calcineurin-like phosphoesterase domain-containing protein n=1 Tax=Boudabousia liubingyangii TaxID=1921764 RepID=A0A1Q5PPQ2_9ACTO|nr:metallophosphoesterase [Boudabousia liubingyangii]OKL49499.1 hypothetical protein BSR29_00620 [Boudabousia liubingyangii]
MTSTASKLVRYAGITLGLGVASAASLYAGGTWARKRPRVEVRRWHTGKLSTPLKVLHVADPHLGKSDQWLKAFMQSLAALDPDLVVSTGDNFGDVGVVEDLKEAYAPLLQFPGVFVYGSNDYYSPKPKAWYRYLFPHLPAPKRNVPDLPYQELTDFLTSAGWSELYNRTQVLDFSGGMKVSVTGTADAHIKRDRLAELGPLPQADFHLGVTHAPYQRILNAFRDRKVDLTFAGHTHGGQFCLPNGEALVTNCDLPRPLASGAFDWLPAQEGELAFVCHPESASLPVGADLGAFREALEAATGSSVPSVPDLLPQGTMRVYISPGLGTSKFAPLRFFCPPTATLWLLS